MEFKPKTTIEEPSKNNQEEKTSIEKAEEIYKSEILPIIEILKPEDISFEEYEVHLKNELFEDVKKLQTSRNEIVVDPEQNTVEVKDLLNSRIKSLLDDHRNAKNEKIVDEYLVKKAKLALLFQGDEADIIKDVHLGKFLNLKDMQVYLSGEDLLQVEDINILMNTTYSDILAKNFEGRFDFEKISEGGTELLISKMFDNGLTYDIEKVISISGSDLSLDLFNKLMENKDTKSIAIKKASHFKEVNSERILSFYLKDKSSETISNIRNSDLDENIKKKILEEILLNYISENPDGFYNLDFYLRDPVFLDGKTEVLLIKSIGEKFYDRVGASFISSIDSLRKNNISEDIINKGMQDGVLKSLLSGNESVIYNIPTAVKEVGVELSLIYESRENIEALSMYFKNSFKIRRDEDLVMKIVEKLEIPSSVLSLPEIQSPVESYILSNSTGYNKNWFEKWGKTFYFSSEKTNTLKFKILEDLLKDNNSYQAIELTKEDSLNKDFLQNKDFQILVQESLIRQLKSQVGDFEKYLDVFKIPQDFLNSQELINAAKSGVLYSMSLGGSELNVKNIIKTVSFEQDFFKSPEMIDAVESNFEKKIFENESKESLENDLNDYGVSLELIDFEKISERAFEKSIYDISPDFEENIRFLIKQYDIDKHFVGEKIEKAILDHFENTSSMHYLFFQDLIIDSENFLKRKEVIESLDIGFIKSIEKKYPGPIKFFYENLPKENIEQHVEEIEEIMEQNINDEVWSAHLASSSEPFDNLQKMIDILPYENKPFETMYEIFGSSLNQYLYEEMKDLYREYEVGKNLKELGVKSFGNDGVRELKESIVELKNKFTKIDFNPNELLESEAKLNIFKSYTGFDKSTWGDTKNDSLKKIIGKSLETAEAEPRFPESNIIHIDKLKQKDRSEIIEYTPDFVDRFNLLLDDVTQAKITLEEQEKPLSHLTNQISEKLVLIKSNLQEKLSETDNEFALKNLQEKISLVETMDVRSIKDFQDNFKVLSQFKELESELRQAMFTFAFAKNRNYLNKELDEINRESPDVDDVSWVVDFVDHITNREVMGQYFTDKQSKRAFEKNINPKALILELSKLQKDNTTDGKTSFKFIPSRNLLTEISGHTGNACWANKYESIVEELPNVSSVTMVMNPENKFERTAGSSMIIETQAENGDDLLIIRGLNPQENIINQLSVDDFYEQFTMYMKDVAEQSGKKLAISIDDHSGGHTTNRPVLFENIKQRGAAMKRVALKNPDEAKFNGYDISTEVYLVE